MSSDPDASARWLVLHDEMLRGITHALSNRIATVGAASYMFEHGDTPLEEAIASLRNESERLDHLLQLLRLLPGRPNAEAEPIAPSDAVNSAISMHAHHPDLRDFPCEVDMAMDTYPAWAEPHALGHALLVALNTAKRYAAPGGRIYLRVSSDNDMVRFRATSNASTVPIAADGQADAATAAWLLAPHGGLARSVEGGCEIAVPTLLAARRNRKN